MSLLLYIKHNSYYSFAVETQVPEPLKQNHDFTELKPDEQIVLSLLGDNCKNVKRSVVEQMWKKHMILIMTYVLNGCSQGKKNAAFLF